MHPNRKIHFLASKCLTKEATRLGSQRKIWKRSSQARTRKNPSKKTIWRQECPAYKSARKTFRSSWEKRQSCWFQEGRSRPKIARMMTSTLKIIQAQGKILTMISTTLWVLTQTNPKISRQSILPNPESTERKINSEYQSSQDWTQRSSACWTGSGTKILTPSRK